MNPPPTPKKPSLDKQKEIPVMERLRRQCRGKWAWYTPADIQEIDCDQSLNDIFYLYYERPNPPFPDYSDVEFMYCWLMRLCIYKRLCEL